MSAKNNSECEMNWLPQPPIACPFLKDPPPPVLEALKHNQLFCDYCVKTRIHQLTGGEDVIFQGNPPWKKQKLQATSDEPAVEGKEVSTAKRPRREKRKKPDDHLPDGLIIKSYVNQGLSKEDALQKLIREKREKAKTMKKAEDEAQKTRTDFNEMPYVPPVPFTGKTSFYTDIADHQRYVAIASNFLNAIPKFRFESNKAELKSMDQKLAGERLEFQNMVLKKLESRKGNPYYFGNFGASRFVLGRINRRRMRLKGYYGTPVTILVDEMLEDANDLSLNLKRVLHSGRLRKISVPNEKRKFRFSSDAKEISENFPLGDSDKFPITEDDTALSLALENDIGIVTGVSSMVAIMSQPEVADISRYLLPVEIKRVYNEHKGQATNICIIGKPVVDSLVSLISIWYKYIKYTVKHYLYPEEKIPAKTGGRQRTVQKKKKASPEPLKVLDIMQGSSSSDEDKALVIDPNEQLKTSDCENTKTPKKCCDSGTEDLVGASTCEDVVGDIMKQMGISGDEIASAIPTIESSEMDSKHLTKSGDIRKRYSLFSLDERTENIANFLVRSNNEGLDNEGTPVVISNKIEYAGDYGAERLTPNWLLREVLKCKLKGVHDLIRYRIHHSQLFLLQKERAVENKLLERIINGKTLIMQSYRRLKAVIQHLKGLEQGSYLLRCDHGTIELYSSVQKKEIAVIDFNAPWNADIGKNLPPVESLFNGIDEHVVLVYHTIRKQIPAAFSHSLAGKVSGGRTRKKDISAPKDFSQMSKSARRRYKRKLGRQEGREKQDGMNKETLENVS